MAFAGDGGGYFFVRSGSIVPSHSYGAVGLQYTGSGLYRSSCYNKFNAYYLNINTKVNPSDESSGYGSFYSSSGFPLRCLAS